MGVLEFFVVLPFIILFIVFPAAALIVTAIKREWLIFFAIIFIIWLAASVTYLEHMP